jgi:hypothetical protein
VDRMGSGCSARDMRGEKRMNGKEAEGRGGEWMSVM